MGMSVGMSILLGYMHLSWEILIMSKKSIYIFFTATSLKVTQVNPFFFYFYEVPSGVT